MKQLNILIAVLALTLIAFFPVAARADEDLEGLDVTMIVVDDEGDLEDSINEMEGPDDGDVDDDDWEDDGDHEDEYEDESDSNDDDSASEDEFEDEVEDEMDHDSDDDGF
ncbi:MAG: hypothetical protein OEY74_01720, partial [Gammaproteobacteria bacterium]|nr:hypothetical protein [Gammaproteobacteria bacterium]